MTRDEARVALERVRMELCFMHGVVATDVPDLPGLTDMVEAQLAWEVDNRALREGMDEALSVLFGPDNAADSPE